MRVLAARLPVLLVENCGSGTRRPAERRLLRGRVPVVKLDSDRVGRSCGTCSTVDSPSGVEGDGSARFRGGYGRAVAASDVPDNLVQQVFWVIFPDKPAPLHATLVAWSGPWVFIGRFDVYRAGDYT